MALGLAATSPTAILAGIHPCSSSGHGYPQSLCLSGGRSPPSPKLLPSFRHRDRIRHKRPPVTLLGSCIPFLRTPPPKWEGRGYTAVSW